MDDSGCIVAQPDHHRILFNEFIDNASLPTEVTKKGAFRFRQSIEQTIRKRDDFHRVSDIDLPVARILDHANKTTTKKGKAEASPLNAISLTCLS